jgi:hypothetical protein
MSKDLFHGQGNATTGMPMSVKHKAGQTDPEMKNSGKLLKTKKTVQKGWNK